MSLAPEIAAKVVEAYKRGERVVDIQRKLNVHGGPFYKALRDAHVVLRYEDPTHPASSLATRRAAGHIPPAVPPPQPVPTNTTKPPANIPENIPQKPKLSAVNQLIILPREEIDYFKKLWNLKIKEYGQEQIDDAYGEAWVEYIEHIADRLEVWQKRLGSSMGLLGITAVHEAIRGIEALEPKQKNKS